MNKTVTFVIGATASGKTTFIKDHFSNLNDTVILNVYDYQQAVYAEAGYSKHIPLGEEFKCLHKANENLLTDIIKWLQDGKNVVVEQTLYKAKRRIGYIDTIRDAIENAKLLSALHIDIVKLHSLYIAKNTKLSKQYKDGTITVCSKEEYLERVIAFLIHLSPNIVVERLFSRVPEGDADFSNWNTSWWKLQDDLLNEMQIQDAYQGKEFNYLNGSALNKL